MKLTGQAAIEAKRSDDSVVLMAKFNGKNFGRITEKNAKEVIERGGEVWAEITLPDNVKVEAYRTPKTHDQIVIERAQRRAANGKR